MHLHSTPLQLQLYSLDGNSEGLTMYPLQSAEAGTAAESWANSVVTASVAAASSLAATVGGDENQFCLNRASGVLAVLTTGHLRSQSDQYEQQKKFEEFQEKLRNSEPRPEHTAASQTEEAAVEPEAPEEGAARRHKRIFRAHLLDTCASLAGNPLSPPSSPTAQRPSKEERMAVEAQINSEYEQSRLEEKLASVPT